MPLDSEIAKVLEARNAANIPSFETLEPQEARRVYAAMERPRVEVPLSSVRDHRLEGPGGELAVRVYLPLAQGPFPVLVYFHGGGWVVGNLDTHDSQARGLCAGSGCAVVSVDYRLAPEHPYPAAPEDCYTAMEWVCEHADALGLDRSRLAVGGDSAGANLATVLALMARDRQGPELRFQLLVYPATDDDFSRASCVENAEGYLLSTAAMRWFWDQYVPDRTRRSEPYCAPAKAQSHVGLPPALVITAEFDPLRDDGNAYAGLLQRSGVPTRLACYPGAVHGFLGMGAVSALARDAMREACEALHRALR
jgi:acetyl esterase